MGSPRMKQITRTSRTPELAPVPIETELPDQPRAPLKDTPTKSEADGLARLRAQYECGPIQFAGSNNALYERHLVFDNVNSVQAASSRERFHAFARSVRDILSQRWVGTEETYARKNPKRIYYLSMEYLIGRSLANNVTNLLLDPLARHVAAQKNLDLAELLEQEPDAGLGNGGLGRLAAPSLDPTAPTYRSPRP